MMRELETYCVKMDPPSVPSAWLIAGLPVAVFHGNMWQRGIISDVSKSGLEMSVYFVDFGGNCIAKRENIRLLRQSDMEYPAFALNVAYYGILPSNLNGRLIYYFNIRWLNLFLNPTFRQMGNCCT